MIAATPKTASRQTASQRTDTADIAAFLIPSCGRIQQGRLRFASRASSMRPTAGFAEAEFEAFVKVLPK